MRFYWPIAKVEAERRMVWGYASTEAEDDQGEVIRREAIAAALDDYMRFANIREMHQLSAVGVAQQAQLDDKGLYLGARIVDHDAWRKVVEGVYKGFSIGGRVTGRDPADRKQITGLLLTEISLVDRPANPEAVFDCWKRAAAPAPGEGGGAPPAVEYADPAITGVNPAARPPQLAAGLDWPREGTAGDEAADMIEPALARRLQSIADELLGFVGSLIAGGDDPAPPLAELAASGLLRKAERRQIAMIADGLAKLAADLVPRLDALQQRVDEIARTPLPPQTVARGFVGLSKREDGGAAAEADIVAALARMSEEERTLTLIKAAHANPIRR